jgi:hypothetical protein
MVFQTHGEKNSSGLRTMRMKSPVVHVASDITIRRRWRPKFHDFAGPRSGCNVCLSSETVAKFSAHSTAAIPRSFPRQRRTVFNSRRRDCPRSPGNKREWLDTCKGGKVKPGEFRIRAPCQRDLASGNLAARMGQKLTWDRPSLSVNCNVAWK